MDSTVIYSSGFQFVQDAFFIYCLKSIMNRKKNKQNCISNGTFEIFLNCSRREYQFFIGCSIVTRIGSRSGKREYKTAYTINFCLIDFLNFSIKKFQDSGYNLTVKLIEYNQTEIVLWNLIDNRAIKNTWSLGQVYFKTNDSYKISFELYAGSNQNNFVGK